MRLGWGYLALFAVVAAILVFFAYAVVESQGVSRNISIAELRAGGVDFVLEGVRFHEIAYSDSQFPDGPSQAIFQITFPDGAQENLTLFFGGFCTAGYTIQTSTVHRNPGAFFSYTCGEQSIRISVV